MRIVCDEGLERQVPARLEDSGHQVWYLADLEPGLPDEEVLRLCREQEGTLITNDKDFGELVFRKGRFIRA